MFGLLIGSFFFGWLSDAVGRVPSLVAAGITLLLSQGNQSEALIKNCMIVLFIIPFRIATLIVIKDR
jgi:MFS family permease